MKSFEVTSGTKIKPKACVVLNKKGRTVSGIASGDGPIDAVFNAIDKVTGYKAKLDDFRLEAVTAGKDALGQVSLKLKIKENFFSGRGASTDIIEAGIRAYLDAVNRLEYK